MLQTEQQFEEIQVGAIGYIREVVINGNPAANTADADRVAKHFQDQIGIYRGKVIDELDRVLKDEPPTTGKNFSEEDCSNTTCTQADGTEGDTEMGGT